MNQAILMIVPSAAAAALAFVLSPLAARLAMNIGAVDMPGDRKIHNRPIPRLGGVAVVGALAVVIAGSLVWNGGRFPVQRDLALGILWGVLPVVLISFIDDLRGVKALPKFVAHVIGASIAASFGVSLAGEVHLLGSTIHVGFLAAPVSVLWIVGVTNAFNIIDGLDGLAAGLALIAAASMGVIFVLVQQPVMAGAAFVLVGALAGFLPYNAHPARLFLGDTGATAIGFCLACFALRGGSTLSTGFAALMPVFVMGLPIADTLIAMARRILRRVEQKSGGMFVADRNHIHHRLLAHGLDHGRAVLVLYGAGLIFAAAALVSVFLEAREAALFVLALLLAGMLGVHRLGFDEFAVIRRGTMLRMYEMPVVKRSMFAVFVDIAMTIFAAYIAIGLKMDLWTWHHVRPLLFDLAGAMAPLTVLVFWKAGLYRGAWRLAGIEDLMRACAATAGVVVLALIGHAVWSPVDVPASVFLIYGLISMACVATSRSSYVLLRHGQRRANNQGIPVLLYGAGLGGVAGVRELFENPQKHLRPIGFIDDDAQKAGRVVSGLPVLGSESALDEIIRQHGVKALLLTSAKIAASRVQRAKRICDLAGVNLMRLDIRFEQLNEVGAPVPADPQATAAEGITIGEAIATSQGSFGELGVLGVQPCQQCGSRNVHRSKARNVYERVRKAQTPKRLYRCHDCGWRGWLLPLEFGISEVVPGRLDETDLSLLDRWLKKGVPDPATEAGLPSHHLASNT